MTCRETDCLLKTYINMKIQIPESQESGFFMEKICEMQVPAGPCLLLLIKIDLYS